MKNKTLIKVSLLIVLLYSITIFIIFNKTKHNAESEHNYEIVEKVKSDFITELNLQNPFSEYTTDSFILLGQYKEGYILLRFFISAATNYNEINPITVELDGVAITFFPFVYFYYFSGSKIVEKLEQIYNENLIDYNDLVDIKNKFNEWADYNYYIQTDYIIEYALDNRNVVEESTTKEQIKNSFVSYYNKINNENKSNKDFYFLGKYSFVYLFVNNPIDSFEEDYINIKTANILFNKAQEFYFYYPYSDQIYIGLNHYNIKKLLSYNDYLDIKYKLELFKDNYYLVQYDFTID